VTVTAYPVAGKRKSFEICLSFARSCGGQIAGAYRDGTAFFYGVDASNLDLYQRARAAGDYFYCDNSVFDSERQQRFRIARNRLQHNGLGQSDCRRFNALGIAIRDWATRGEHIVVCPQSDFFMRDVVGYDGNWLDYVRARLALVTDRPLRIRPWNRDKGALSATLKDDLAGAHALVTWSSAAAVTAVLEGIPVVVMSDECVARPMSGTLDQIEDLPRPDGRRNWAGVLADNEWTLREIADGTAWGSL
jgi:hypothetical protein